MTSPAALVGTVFAAGGGLYEVRLASGDLVEAALRGRLKQERRTGDRVVIGDQVTVVRSGDLWTVESVAPRDSELVRRGAGGRLAKVVAANVRRVLAVVAARDPDVSLGLVDRLLVVAESSGVPPVLVVNKIDLPGGREKAAELAGLYGGIGYRVLQVSVALREGLGALEAELENGTSVLVGPSGAGKSSILNALRPQLELRTGGLSVRTGRGRHATVSARLIPLSCGGTVADTPGFGDVGLWGVPPEDVGGCFPELVALVEECRFRGCAHLREPDCAVREAVGGAVAESRYRSYVTLRGEAAEQAQD